MPLPRHSNFPDFGRVVEDEGHAAEHPDGGVPQSCCCCVRILETCVALDNQSSVVVLYSTVLAPVATRPAPYRRIPTPDQRHLLLGFMAVTRKTGSPALVLSGHEENQGHLCPCNLPRMGANKARRHPYLLLGPPVSGSAQSDASAKIGHQKRHACTVSGGLCPLGQCTLVQLAKNKNTNLLVPLVVQFTKDKIKSRWSAPLKRQWLLLTHEPH